MFFNFSLLTFWGSKIINKAFKPFNNNRMSDVFHSVYRELTDTEKTLLDSIKKTASDLLGLFGQIKTEESGRELSLAKTKLEESVMWAVKGLTK